MIFESQLEQMSKSFNLGFLSDEAFFALRKAKSGIALKQKDLTSLDEALEYIGLIEEGYKRNEEFWESGTIYVTNQSQKQFEALNLYLQFARESGVANIADSIRDLKETLKKTKNKKPVEKRGLEYAEKLFSYLLIHSLDEFQEALGYA